MSQVIGSIPVVADGLSGSKRRRAGYNVHCNAIRRRNRYPSDPSGAHGTDANPSGSGEDGGSLRLTLEPVAGNGFTSRNLSDRVHGQEQHCPVGYDVFASARGGDGEDGGVGGNGEDGREGYRGADATRSSEATRGGNGGDGGDGGFGTDGGHGGNGGNVAVYMSEHDMHLAYAVHWDVRGGKGGRAGRHGAGGQGGRGGKGGNGTSWNEVTGYEWRCASDCCAYSSSNAVTSSNHNDFSQLQSGRSLGVYIRSGLVSDGTTTIPIRDIAGIIPSSLLPSLAASSNALTTGSRALTTRSNGEHAPGCGDKPIYEYHSRPSAASGHDGADGITPETLLNAGHDGGQGSTCFVVTRDGRINSTYRSAFDFHLDGFEVRDENRDGIFEPGECAIIHSVTVSNSGEMPTPKHTNIPITMQDSCWLRPTPMQGSTSVPRNICQREAKIATGEIWAHIPNPSRSLSPGTIFQKNETIGLIAVIPDLQRIARNFDITRSVTIQYPLAMENESFMWLDSIPLGSRSSFKWKVLNKSVKDLGRDSESRRRVTTEVSCLGEAPAILGQRSLRVRGPASMRSEQELLQLRRRQSRQVSENVEILEDAEEYSKIEFGIELRATPVSSIASRQPPERNRILIQTKKITVQVSNRYRYNPESPILIVTNYGVTKERVHAWENFVRSQLHAQADIWNLSHYGGFTQEGDPESVLSRYRGKTIICLDYQTFQFCGSHFRDAIDFIEPRHALPLNQNGTRLTFASNMDRRRHDEIAEKFRNVALTPTISNDAAPTSNEHRFSRTKDLVRHVRLEGESCNACTRQDLRYLLKSPRSGKGIARKLRRHLPLDQFVVKTDTDGFQVDKCQSHGQAFTTVKLPSDRVNEQSQLSNAGSFSCVASLPILERLDMLHESDSGDHEIRYSELILRAAKLSLLYELHAQTQCMTRRSCWSDNLFNFNPAKMITTPLQGLVHDKITNVFNHDLMNPPAGVPALSKTAEEILSSLVLSARCQNNRQLLLRWFMPLKRTQSHVRRGLLARVREVIASGVEGDSEEAQKEKRKRFKAFKKKVPQKALHKNQLSDLDNQLRDLTGNSVKSYGDLYYGLDEAFPKSVYLIPDKLEKLRKTDNKARKQRVADYGKVRCLKNALGLRQNNSSRPVINEVLERAQVQAPGAANLALQPRNEQPETLEVGNSNAAGNPDADPAAELGQRVRPELNDELVVDLSHISEFPPENQVTHQVSSARGGLLSIQIAELAAATAPSIQPSATVPEVIAELAEPNSQRIRSSATDRIEPLHEVNSAPTSDGPNGAPDPPEQDISTIDDHNDSTVQLSEVSERTARQSGSYQQVEDLWRLMMTVSFVRAFQTATRESVQ